MKDYEHHTRFENHEYITLLTQGTLEEREKLDHQIWNDYRKLGFQCHYTQVKDDHTFMVFYKKHK